MDWVKNVSKMNEAVGEKNRLDKSGGSKLLVSRFTKNKLCKFIGCILLAVYLWYERTQALGVNSNIFW